MGHHRSGHPSGRGLLKIRSQLGLFGNLRPALLYPQLADASSLKPEIVAGLDILIVRELTGGIYFGQPRESKVLENGERMAYDTLPYSESEIRRIAKVGFDMAMVRNKLCSVDKANVLASSQLWRAVVEEVARTTRKSNSAICMSITRPCSWCARRSSST